MEFLLRNQYFYSGIDSPIQIEDLLRALSKNKVFLIIDRNIKNGFLDQLITALETNELISSLYLHDGREPSTEIVEEVKLEVSKVEIDSIMAIGGGSTLDLMKAISVLRFLNVTAAEAQGAMLDIKQKLFSIAVPTTAGSGSEATKSAVLTNLNAKLKRGVNHLRVIPDVAILVPKLLEGIPDNVFVASVFDGLTHAIESLLGQSGTEDIKVTARYALRIYLRQLQQLSQEEPVKIDAQILEASYYAGVAICNSETGPIHAISYPLSEHCNYGHGEAIGLLLPKVLKVYLQMDEYFEDLLESYVGIPPKEFIVMLEKVYSKYVRSPENLKAVKDIEMLAARSLQLLGAISNSPFIWHESLSVQVLSDCI
jgi:alcohol dehydrogenase class IV